MARLAHDVDFAGTGFVGGGDETGAEAVAAVEFGIQAGGIDGGFDQAGDGLVIQAGDASLVNRNYYKT